jgi:hypothetical protein
MGEPVTLLVPRELIDRLQSALPSEQPADTARRVLEAIRRLSRATSASAYRERAGMLRWIAGQRLPEAAIRSIRTAIGHESAGARSIWVSEGDGGWECSWVLWSGRPHDAERDVVHLAGPRVRAPKERGGRIARLSALLSALP